LAKYLGSLLNPPDEGIGINSVSGAILEMVSFWTFAK